MALGPSTRAGLKTVCHTVDFGDLAGREDFHVYSRYTDLRPLGSGGYGYVVAATDYNDGLEDEVVIKKLHTIFKSPALVKAGLREVTLLLFFVHDNILSLRDLILPMQEEPDGELCFDSSQLEYYGLYLVLDKMTCDLGHLIYADMDLPIDVRRLISYQILRGLKCIHSARVLHRDLKPQNILVNDECDVKICDFGLARDYVSNGMTTNVATQFYRAPELLLEMSKDDDDDGFSAQTMYTEAVDVWSVGCIMAELILRRPLFHCTTSNPAGQISTIFSLLGRPTVTEDMSHDLQSFLTVFRGPHFPPRPWDDILSAAISDPEERDLISQMVVFDPSKRISVPEALAHPFFEDLHDPDDEPDAPTSFTFRINHPECPYLDLLSHFAQMHPEARSVKGWPNEELTRCNSGSSVTSASDIVNTKTSFLAQSMRSMRLGRYGSVRHAFAETNAMSFRGMPSMVERSYFRPVSNESAADHSDPLGSPPGWVSGYGKTARTSCSGSELSSVDWIPHQSPGSRRGSVEEWPAGSVELTTPVHHGLPNRRRASVQPQSSPNVLPRPRTLSVSVVTEAWPEQRPNPAPETKLGSSPPEVATIPEAEVSQSVRFFTPLSSPDTPHTGAHWEAQNTELLVTPASPSRPKDKPAFDVPFLS